MKTKGVETENQVIHDHVYSRDIWGVSTRRIYCDSIFADILYYIFIGALKNNGFRKGLEISCSCIYSLTIELC